MELARAEKDLFLHQRRKAIATKLEQLSQEGLASVLVGPSALKVANQPYGGLIVGSNIS